MKRLLLYMMFFVAQSGTRAQVLTLDSILNAVDKANPALKVFDARIRAYDAYAAGARAQEAPQAGAGFFMTPYDPAMWKADPLNGSRGMGSLMISAQQMLIHPQKLRANETYMQNMSAIDNEMKKAEQNDLHSMAKMNYYELIILQKKLAVFSESESILNYVLKSAELRYTYGMDKLNSYYKAQAMLADIQKMQLMTRQEISQQRIALQTLMNRKDTSFRTDTSFLIRAYELNTIDTSSISINRSDYRALSKNIDVLKSKQEYEKSKRLPDFGVKYDHMLAFGTQPQQFSLMAMVSLPFAPWSSKMYKSSVKGLQYEIEFYKTQQQAFLLNTDGTLKKLSVELLSKKQQLALFEKNILPAMQMNYKSSLLAYEQNTEELFMVLDAWQNLKIAQTGYLDLLKEVLLLQVSYEREMELK